MGNSKKLSASSISFGAFSQSKTQLAKWLANCALSTLRFQSSRGGASPGSASSAMKFSMARPSGNGAIG